MMDMYALLMGGSGGGGGSGLPSVTSADIGKSLIVGKKAELTTIFSEQIVEVSSGQAVLVGANTSLWTASREVSIGIDGNITTGTLIDQYGAIGISVGASGAIALIDGNLVLYWDSDGDKTISIDAVSTSEEWEKDYAVLVAKYGDDGVLDHTYKQIHDARFSVLENTNSDGNSWFPVFGAYKQDSNTYVILSYDFADEPPTPLLFIASTENGNPTLSS